MCSQDFQVFRRHCVSAHNRVRAAVINETIQNLTPVQTRFWVETEEKPVHLKYLLLLKTCTPRFSGLPPALQQ